VLKGKLLAILGRPTMVKSSPGDASNIDATCKPLSDEEAKAIAKDIVDIAFNEEERLADTATNPVS
jgi:hypothetical protein